jgi:hypothetical protein
MATQTTTVSGDIPAVLEPFYVGERGLLERGVQQIFQPFEQRYAPVIQQGYMGEGQIAGMSPFQEQVGQRLQNMQMPGQFGLATEAGQQSAAGLQSLMGTQAMGVAAPELTQFQLGPARQFTGAESQQYMSPYIQGVVDVQQRKAIDAARQAQLGQNLAAARQGTYGGARQALLQGQRESGLRTQLGDIQAQGLQSAFDQAQQQFERDRAAQMGIGQQNLQQLLVFNNSVLVKVLKHNGLIKHQDYRRLNNGVKQQQVLDNLLKHLVAWVLNSLPVSLMLRRR